MIMNLEMKALSSIELSMGVDLTMCELVLLLLTMVGALRHSCFPDVVLCLLFSWSVVGHSCCSMLQMVLMALTLLLCLFFLVNDFFFVSELGLVEA
jgi:hypothetical protein